MIARLPTEWQRAASTGFGLTFAGRLLAGPTFALVLAGWLQGGRSALAASIVASTFLLSALASALHLRGLRVGSPPPAQAEVGSILALPFPIKNESTARSLAAVRLDTERERSKDHPSSGQVSGLAAGESAEVQVGARLGRRGRQTTLTLVASSAFPLGLVRRIHRFELDADLLGLPRTGQLARMDLQASSPRHRAHDGRNRPGEEEMAGLRDWRPGDPLRRVHWRRSATREHLVLREMQRAAAPPFEIWLDTNAASGRSFERAAQIAATLLERTLREERRCVLRIGIDGEPKTLSGPGAWLEGRTLLALATPILSAREQDRAGLPAEAQGRRIAWVLASGRGRFDDAQASLEDHGIMILDADAPHLARGLHTEVPAENHAGNRSEAGR